MEHSSHTAWLGFFDENMLYTYTKLGGSDDSFFRLVSEGITILSNARSKTISNFVHSLNVLFNAKGCRYMT